MWRPIGIMKRRIHIAWLLVLASVLPAAASFGGSDAGDTLETVVGMEGTYYLRHGGSAVETLPVDENSPVVLRIADVVQDASSTICEIRFIGMKPGHYDLRDFLRRVDGQRLTDIGPIVATVRSVLPANHNGQLDELARPPLGRTWPYRVMLLAFGGLWLMPLVWLVPRAIVRRRTRPKPLPAREPTLADQLHPLVEAAVAGCLSPAEQARLELLLIGHWRKRLNLAECSTAEALMQLRGHPEAGVLLGQLEHWLHQRPSDGQVDVAAILRPYRDQKPIDPAEIAAKEAPE
jgi:hypothetical protein